MENIEELKKIISKDIPYHRNKFQWCCLINDICFKNYCYRPQFKGRQTIHLWEHQYTTNILTVTHVRLIFQTHISELFSNLIDYYLEESRKYEPTNTSEREFNEWQVNQRKMIKKIDEKDIMIKSGELFKEFVDCYRNGYFE